MAAFESMLPLLLSDVAEVLLSATDLRVLVCASLSRLKGERTEREERREDVAIVAAVVWDSSCLPVVLQCNAHGYNDELG